LSVQGEAPPSEAGADAGRVGLSIPTRIFLGFALVLVLFGSVLAYNFARLNELYEGVTALSRGLFPLRVALSEVAVDLRSYAGLLAERDPVALRDAVLASRVLSPFGRRIDDRLEQALETIDELMAREEAIRDVGLERLRAAMAALERRNALTFKRGDALAAVLESETFAGLERVRQALVEHLSQMERQVLSVTVTTDSVVTAALDRARQEREGSLVVVAATTAGTLVVAVFVMLWAARMLRPLTRLIEGVKTLRGGRYETVEVSARDEIGELAAEFNQMVRALEERDRRLREGRVALERAHRMALEAERLAAIGRLTSQITHEIRNPLSSIGLNIEMLEEEIRELSEEPGEALGLIRKIHEEIDRLTSITHEYLQFARLPEPKRTSVDLSELVQELVSFHGSELTQARIELNLALEPELPSIEADPSQLRQAVLNLVKNAREAMPRGGRLELTTRRVEAGVELVVADAGEGVDPEARDRIFEPFFTTKVHGTGLGLPLTRRIVDQHGGTLQCDAAEGGGAVFTVRLPSGSVQE
jgi:two-component system, NtrC family, sensor kinase